MYRDKDQIEDQQKVEQSQKNDQNSEHSSQMNIETNVNLTKKKRVIFWVYLIVILSFAIVLATLVSSSSELSKQFIKTDSYYYASQVANDWKQGFIKDMKIFNGSTTSSCPSGYEHAVNFEWSGSSIGCYCDMTGGESDVVLSGYCTPSLIQTGCKNIFSQPKLNANYWKNQGIICIQRSSVSFETQKKYDGTNKICGGSQSLIVVPNGQPCPFVNISFSSFSLEDNFVIAQDTNSVLNPIYISFNSTSPYSFYSYPVSKFKVSQYEFCQVDQDSGVDPDHSDFELLNYQRGCVNVGNYTFLDSMSELDFYVNNPALNSLTAIAGFPEPGNWEYKFGFASINGWTYRCRHTFEGKFNIKNALKQFNFTYLTTYNNLIIGITICIIVIGMEIFILALRRLINNAVYPVGYRQKYLFKHFILALSRYIVDFIAKFAIFGILLYNLFNIYENQNWFRTAINLNCADNNYSTIYYILNPFMKLYTKILKYAIGAFVLTVCMILIDIIHFVYIYKAELSYYLIETERQLMVKQEEAKELDWIHQTKDVFDKDALFEKQLPVKNQVDQFRITMAQNIFQREDNQINQNVPQKLKKKKKKKISLFKRKDDIELKDDPIGDSLDFGFNYQQSLNQLQSPQRKPAQRSKLPKRKK